MFHCLHKTDIARLIPYHDIFFFMNNIKWLDVSCGKPQHDSHNDVQAIAYNFTNKPVGR